MFEMKAGWQVNTEYIKRMVWLANFLRRKLNTIFALCDPETGKDYPIDDDFPYRICTDGGVIVIRLTTNNKIVVVECDIKCDKKIYCDKTIYCDITIYTIHVYKSAEAMQMYFKDNCEDNTLILCVEKISNFHKVLSKIRECS